MQASKEDKSDSNPKVACIKNLLYKGGENPPTDSDSEYTEDEADSDSDDNEDIYCPENDSDSYGCDSETKLDATQMNFHENDTEIHKQPKFIVFQNQLLLLLSICLACFSKEVAVNHIVYTLSVYVAILLENGKSQPESATMQLAISF